MMHILPLLNSAATDLVRRNHLGGRMSTGRPWVCRNQTDIEAPRKFSVFLEGGSSGPDHRLAQGTAAIRTKSVCPS